MKSHYVYVALGAFYNSLMMSTKKPFSIKVREHEEINFGLTYFTDYAFNHYTNPYILKSKNSCISDIYYPVKNNITPLL